MALCSTSTPGDTLPALCWLHCEHRVTPCCPTEHARECQAVQPCRRGTCPAAVVEQLFHGAVWSLDERLASACFGALMALLGADQDGLPADALPHGMHLFLR